jgi:hypothetical protein
MASPKLLEKVFSTDKKASGSTEVCWKLMFKRDL